MISSCSINGFHIYRIQAGWKACMELLSYWQTFTDMHCFDCFQMLRTLQKIWKKFGKKGAPLKRCTAWTRTPHCDTSFGRSWEEKRQPWVKRILRPLCPKWRYKMSGIYNEIKFGSVQIQTLPTLQQLNFSLFFKTSKK